MRRGDAGDSATQTSTWGQFTRDRRGQSVVIGTVILFGFLVLALSLYQVQVVPQQNAQVEFQHFEEARNDLVELRATILQTGSTDRPQYPTVRLGTTYPTRIFAINPPSPAGTIQTTESYPITISNESGRPEGSITIPTRFIQYRPGYNELDHSPTWYDTSVLYVDARDEGGGIAVVEDQELITDDGDVRIVALQNEFRRSGTGRVTLELRPAESVTDLPEGPLTVTVPTRLSEDDWNSKTDLPTDSDVYGGVTDANNDGIYNLILKTTADNLTVDTVGIDEAPEEPVRTDDNRGGSETGDDSNNGGTGFPLEFTSLTKGDGGTLTFSATNVADRSVTVTDFSVDATALANNPRVDDGTSPELSITPDSGRFGEVNQDGNGNNGRVNADGEEYALDLDATITSGSGVVIDIRGWEDQTGSTLNFDLERVDTSENADVTVTLIYSDGTQQTFFFEDTS